MPPEFAPDVENANNYFRIKSIPHDLNGVFTAFYSVCVNEILQWSSKPVVLLWLPCWHNQELNIASAYLRTSVVENLY